MRFFKTWKKFGKPKKNFEKISGNPDLSKIYNFKIRSAVKLSSCFFLKVIKY